MIRKFIKPRRIATYFLALVLTLGFAGENARVFAIPDPDFYSGNNILYYDPDFTAACAAGGGSLSGANTPEKIWNYLISRELTPEQAAGVMGNMQAESGLSPTARQGSTDLFNSKFENNAWGLVQWDGGRRFTSPDKGVLGKLRDEKPDLIEYTKYEYKGIKEPNDQIPQADFDALLLFELEYMYEESQTRRVTEDRYGEGENEWETLKMMDTVEEATVFWHNNFEVSADSPERVLATRGGAAQGFFDDLSGTSTTGSPTNCNINATGLQELVLQYAWPNYRGSDTTRTDAYITAMQQSGVYQGACNGVDCGAFTTRLLQDSGFEPNYNDRKGNTTEQKRWAEENWRRVEDIEGDDFDVTQLEPGDVAIKAGESEFGHTFIYVADRGGGKISGLNGEGEQVEFEEVIASSSMCNRAPMAGRESLIDPNFTWYRKG